MKILKIKKKIKKKLKNSVFDWQLIVNQTFLHIGFITGKSGFPHIMHFQ